MSQPLVLSGVALTAAVILLLQGLREPLRIGACLVAGVQVLTVLGLVRLSVSGVSLGLVLGGALAVLGVGLWLKSPAKTGASAATALTFVGALQVVAALH